MSIRLFILGMGLCFVLGLIAFLGILISIDPLEANVFVKILFFACLFLVLASLFSLLGFILRKKPKILFKRATIAFWQAVLISGFLILILILWRFIKNLI